MGLRDVKDLGMMNPKFRAQLEEEQRKQAIAEAIMKQGQGGGMQYLQQPQGGRFGMQQAKLPMGANIASVLQSALGAYMGQKAQTGAGQAMQLNADEVASGKTQYNAMPNKEMAAQSLLGSQNPALAQFGQSEIDQQRKIAEEMAKREQARLLAGAGLTKDQDPAAGMRMLGQNQLDPNWTPPKLGGPEFGSAPDGSVYGILPQPGGKRDFRFTPKPDTTTVSVGGDTEKEGLKALGKKLPDIAEKSQTDMARAVKGLDDAERIYSLANDPSVSTGAFAEPELFLRNLGAKLGFGDAEGVAKTQALISSIAEQTLDASIDLKGAITEKEWPRLAQARAGEITYTPEALKVLAKIQRAREFNRYIQAYNQRSSMERNQVGGASANFAAFPAPALGDRVMPEEDYGSRADGTVFYKGSTEALFGGNMPKPAKPTAPVAGKGIKQMSSAEIEAEIKRLEAELFGGKK